MNIGRLVVAPGDPRVAEFMGMLERNQRAGQADAGLCLRAGADLWHRQPLDVTVMEEACVHSVGPDLRIMEHEGPCRRAP